MAGTSRAALVAAVLALGTTNGAKAADLDHPHRHVRYVVRVLRGPPPGYAYGGYGDGRGPGWVASEAPGYASGITPGYGYIPAGAPPTIFDLGY